MVAPAPVPAPADAAAPVNDVIERPFTIVGKQGKTYGAFLACRSPILDTFVVIVGPEPDRPCFWDDKKRDGLTLGITGEGDAALPAVGTKHAVRVELAKVAGITGSFEATITVTKADEKWMWLQVTPTGPLPAGVSVTGDQIKVAVGDEEIRALGTEVHEVMKTDANQAP